VLSWVERDFALPWKASDRLSRSDSFAPQEATRKSWSHMPKLFISHSVKDLEFVQDELLVVCRALEIEPWYSEREIEAASEWKRSIQTGLETSDWFAVVISDNAAKSNNVRDELDWALNHMRDAVITIRIDDCAVEQFDIALPRIQYIDFRNRRQAREQLIAVLAKTVFGPVENYTRIAPRPISGAWDSYWETKDPSEANWVSEQLEVEARAGVHSMVAKNNSGRFEWSGQGRFLSSTIFVFSWRITGTDWTGVGTVYRNTEGRYLVGYWYGPNTRGDPVIGRWVITRQGVDPVRIAKDWFGPGAAESLQRFLSKP
jgi:hypothetical protein